MKTFNLFLIITLLGFSANAQDTINLSLQPDYAKAIYYDFSTQTAQAFDADAWEVSFMRTGAFSLGTRINTASGIEVYEAANNPADYDSINPANLSSWTRLYNSDTAWNVGAFDRGTATYGWGEYNATNHHVTGTVSFVLKYPDDTYKKFMIVDFWSGYTFKYATWDETTNTWINAQQVNLPNSNNPNQLFNYYNLSTNQSVNAAPALDAWDVVFQKYYTPVQDTLYPVLGVLHNPNISVAENASGAITDTANLDFLTNINAIGYDWKTLNQNFEYEIVPNKYYYLKDEDGAVYRFHFISYEGSATGDLSFVVDNITNEMEVENFDRNNSFSIYPNPTHKRTINILYETHQGESVHLALYAVTGRLLMSREWKSNGLYHHQLDLSKLASGVYLLKFTDGTHTATKKLILN